MFNLFFKRKYILIAKNKDKVFWCLFNKKRHAKKIIKIWQSKNCIILYFGKTVELNF